MLSLRALSLRLRSISFLSLCLAFHHLALGVGATYVAGTGVVNWWLGSTDEYVDATTARLLYCQGVTPHTPTGAIVYSDTGFTRIRRVTPDGIVYTIAGLSPTIASDYDPYGGDGGPANEAFVNNPTGVVYDAAAGEQSRSQGQR